MTTVYCDYVGGTHIFRSLCIVDEVFKDFWKGDKLGVGPDKQPPTAKSPEVL
jgi:hypothetical protein